MILFTLPLFNLYAQFDLNISIIVIGIFTAKISHFSHISHLVWQKAKWMVRNEYYVIAYIVRLCGWLVAPESSPVIRAHANSRLSFLQSTCFLSCIFRIISDWKTCSTIFAD